MSTYAIQCCDDGGPLPRERAAECPADQAATCGPRCLQEALRRFGVRVSLSEAIARCKTTRAGTSVGNLLDAARTLGLRAEVCKAELGTLSGLLPSECVAVIAHIQSRHFVLVDGVCDERVILWDPTEGDRDMTRAEFQCIWDGVLIVLARASGPRDARGPQHGAAR